MNRTLSNAPRILLLQRCAVDGHYVRDILRRHRLDFPLVEFTQMINDTPVISPKYFSRTTDKQFNQWVGYIQAVVGDGLAQAAAHSRGAR